MKNLCKRKFFSVEFLYFAFLYSLIFSSLTLFSLRCASEPGEDNIQQTQQTQQTQQEQNQQQQTQQQVQAPTYNRDVKPILDGKCVGCHSNLSSYSGVVNGVGSGSCANRKYVIKGEPNSSLIYLKITNPPCGGKMPQGGSLSQSEIDTIKDWISAGAPET